MIMVKCDGTIDLDQCRTLFLRAAQTTMMTFRLLRSMAAPQ